MRYYKLIYDYENDEGFINCNVPCIGTLDEYCTSNGIRQVEWENISFEYDSDEGNLLSDYIANVYRWFLVSEKCCTVIMNSVSEKIIQPLPVYLKDKKGIQKEITVQVLNILDIVDNALDLDNSKYDIYELDDEKIISVEKYALTKDMVFGHDIFRLKDDTIPIFVSEKIKKIIEQNDLTGFAFLKVAVN